MFSLVCSMEICNIFKDDADPTTKKHNIQSFHSFMHGSKEKHETLQIHFSIHKIGQKIEEKNYYDVRLISGAFS